MKLLKEIGDKNELSKDFKIRKASRGVIFDEKNQIPILFVSKHNYHKLPGGGVENDESFEMALKREIIEETGCEVKITGEVGKIVEYRSKSNLKQVSCCYLYQITKKGKPNFTKKEIDQGFQIVYMTIDQASKQLKKDITNNYEGSFILQRDLEFLEQAKQIK